jgi:hypothetical protein
MSIVSDMKNNWNRGREYASARKKVRKNFENVDDTILILDNELGPDPDRNHRYYKQSLEPLEQYNKKYKNISRMDDPSIVNFIAESLPRKRKISSKPKRKTLKKCRCKK